MANLLTPFNNCFSVEDIEKLSHLGAVIDDEDPTYKFEGFPKDGKRIILTTPYANRNDFEVASTAVLAYAKLLQLTYLGHPSINEEYYILSAMVRFTTYVDSCIMSDTEVDLNQVCSALDTVLNHYTSILVKNLLAGYFRSKGVCYAPSIHKYMECYALPMEMSRQAKLLKDKYL